MKEDKELVWKELSRETVFEKYGRGVAKVMYELPDGKVSDYYIKEEGRVACALSVTKDGKIVLVRQFRPGPGKILCEIPGGRVEPGENPLAAIERELLEETGYKGTLELVTEVYNCSYSTMQRYCFVATGCEKVAEPAPDGTEFLEVVLVSLDEFREILRSGKMSDVEGGYLGLDYLNLL